MGYCITRLRIIAKYLNITNLVRLVEEEEITQRHVGGLEYGAAYMLIQQLKIQVSGCKSAI